MKASRIILVLLLLVLLGATGFFGYQYFASTARAAASPPAEAAHTEAGQEQAEAGHGETAAPGEANTALYPLKSFVVNLADRSKGRYLKVTLALVVKKAVEARFQHDTLALASIQDRIITILTTKTVEDLLTADGKFLLKQEITLQLNSILGEGSVHDVYFADFIIQ
jgi:flagellar FliL protein